MPQKAFKIGPQYPLRLDLRQAQFQNPKVHKSPTKHGTRFGKTCVQFLVHLFFFFFNLFDLETRSHHTALTGTGFVIPLSPSPRTAGLQSHPIPHPQTWCHSTWTILCCGACPVHGKVFSGTSGLYPLISINCRQHIPSLKHDNWPCLYIRNLVRNR